MIGYTHKHYQPITRMVSKAFLRPEELPEKFIAWLFLTGHCVRPDSLRLTYYYRLRAGLADWTAPGCGVLPQGLDAPLRYWVTPWAEKPRLPIGRYERWLRRWRMGGLLRNFTRMIRAMKEQGWVGPPATGILLVDNEQDRDLFILTDGHHRLGAACALFGTECNIPVYTPQSCIFDWKRTRRAGRGRFSEADTRRIWNHVWSRVDGEA